MCLCGCVSNLHDLASSKDEGEVRNQSVDITCLQDGEKLSRDRALKSLASLYGHDFTSSRPEFKKRHMETFLRKRILHILTTRPR